MIATSGSDAVPAPRLTWLQRSNVTLLVVIPQLLQAAAVGFVVMAFLVVFALIAIPASVQVGWVGGPTRDLIAVVLLDELRTLSEELLIVSAVLGGIVGLYFSGLSITDPKYRSDQFDPEVAGVRQILAARALYREAWTRASEPQPVTEP